MRQIAVAGVLAVTFCSSAMAEEASYQAQTVVAAQEALVRLGYDPGPVDGKWGGAARKAMNELREANGLPAVKDFVGSSLALVHRLSPGATTLPHPGTLIVDPVERRKIVEAVPEYDEQKPLCMPKGADDELIGDIVAAVPVAVVEAKVNQSLGYVTHSDDWYTPIVQGVMAGHSACIAGSDNDCKAVVDLLSNWADANALKPGAKRSQKAFQTMAWIGNTILRTLTFAYADARKLASVEPAEDAKILDWLKRRIDEYHYIFPSGNDPASTDYYEAGNHALADMMPAMAFGAMVGDRSMMEPAFATWREVLRVMRDDGSLPNETKRGARALHYTNFQIGQLLSTAEVARMQGIDPSGDEAKSGKTIQKAVGFLLDAYENFDLVAPYSKKNEGSPSRDYTLQYANAGHIGWVPAYFAHFGKDENVARMSKLVLDDRICSDASLDENKLSRQYCEGGTPTFLRLLNMWEPVPSNTMGYSAFCLQGVPRSQWPLK